MNRIGIFIRSDNFGVIAPVTIPAVVTVTSISASLSVTGPAGVYQLITDTTIINSLVRVTDLFYMTLNLDLGSTVESDVVAALIQASAALESLPASSFLISIRAVDELIISGLVYDAYFRVKAPHVFCAIAKLVLFDCLLRQCQHDVMTQCVVVAERRRLTSCSTASSTGTSSRRVRLEFSH